MNSNEKTRGKWIDELNTVSSSNCLWANDSEQEARTTFMLCRWDKNARKKHILVINLPIGSG